MKFSGARLVALILLMALGGCGKTYEWNQKLTVEVQTPDGVTSGSSVQHIVWNSGNPDRPAPNGANADSKYTGEGVAVDLGGGRYMFALLQGTKGFKGDIDKIAFFAFWGMKESPATRESLDHVTSLPIGTSATLEPDNYPMLVTFDDLNDPKSVKLVDPANLAAAFGEGFALKAIRLEITDEKVSEGGMVKVLGWLGPHPEPGLCTASDQTVLPTAAKCITAIF